MTKQVRHQRGYSLVELTIVVGLVAILALAISTVVLMSVSQSARIRNQIHTRQVGDYALTQIQTLVRSARLVTSCDSADNTVTIENPDGDSTTFALELAGDDTHIASNSGTYLTPSDLVVSSFNIDCTPSDTDVRIVSVAFDLDKAQDTGRELETPSIHFETSIELRNN